MLLDPEQYGLMADEIQRSKRDADKVGTRRLGCLRKKDLLI
jgi:hypothetical protein